MDFVFSRKFLGGFASVVVAVMTCGACAADTGQVDAALASARDFVYSDQKDGLWEAHAAAPTKAEVEKTPHSEAAGQWGGSTALAVYALLAAGEDVNSPKLTKAINFLKTNSLPGVYSTGLQAQLFDFLPSTKENRRLAQDEVLRFTSAIFTKKPTAGLFDYLLATKRTYRFDHSVSQYGVLGAWACAQSGAEVPTSFWRSVENAWVRDQLKDGSWCYAQAPEERHPATASMTAAGVATLFITQDYLHASNGIDCNGNVANSHIDLGLDWMGKNFEHVFTDTGSNAPYYALYGVERIGVASGRKYLGKVNWYDRGAEFLLAKAHKHGGWGTLPETCFAMLFLARGRAPVLFNKLQYNIADKEGDWNQRPRDIANLTRWISKTTEHDLNWQIVNLNGPVGELLDAPVLYLSGSQALKFSADEEAKLRQYCEDGGLILGHADCGRSDFANSFRQLGSHLFHDYEFRPLPKDHPIYTNQQFPRTGWKPVPTVLGLSNGVRELMLLIPSGDPARSWQTEEIGHNLPDFELPDDIALYAIDKKNLREKGVAFSITLDPAISTNRTIKLARLQFAGNWNPEPGGWRRMAAILHNRSHIDLQISVAKLGSNQLGDGKTGPTVAVLTGTNSIRLSDAARQEIKNFLTGGGTLIVDAAGGDSEFATEVLTELTTITGADVMKAVANPLPPTAAVYNLPGGVIHDFVYRPFARATVGSVRTPMLAAIIVNKRPAVYVSRLDLSAGLVGQPTDGIAGYDPATATAMMTNLVIAAGLGEKASVSPVK
jgi:hypothetical protein